MKQRLADYVADFFVNHGVTDCFSVVGGGAMHLNDALGHKTLECSAPVFCEIFTDTNQVWEPKSKARKLPDGSLVSPPLENLAPLLPRAVNGGQK